MANLMLWIAASAWGGDLPEVLEQRLGELSELRADRGALAPPELTAEEYAAVGQGKTVVGLVSVDGHKAKKAYGARIVNLPLEKLYPAVADELGALAYTKIEYSELVVGARCQSGRQVLQYLSLPLVSDRWWITRLSDNQVLAEKSGGRVREVYWDSSVDPTLVTSERGREIVADSIPLGFTRGAWFVASLDDAHSLLEYHVWTDPGGKIPAGLASSFASGGVKDTLDAIERFAREGSPACRP